MAIAIDFSKALTVFLISIATVIGPTPPGTGVMKEDRRETSSKINISYEAGADFSVASGIRLMPTSITIAPSLTILLSTKCGFPIAAMRISACSVCFAKSGVREWQ